MSRWVAHSDIEQHGAAWLEFDTGLTYYYERGAGVHGETANETRIQGTKGGLRLQFPTWDSNVIEYFHIVDDEPRKETFTVDFSSVPDDGEALIGHFLDCLDGTAQPLMTVQRAAQHMDILFKIIEGN
jgi:predicted dehydrogenase